MITIRYEEEKEVLDEEAVTILNEAYRVHQTAGFWSAYKISPSMIQQFIKLIRKNRNKEPDFAEGENEPNDVCSPPTRAGN